MYPALGETSPASIRGIFFKKRGEKEVESQSKVEKFG